MARIWIAVLMGKVFNGGENASWIGKGMGRGEEFQKWVGIFLE
jgi:hypothetical protein